MEKTELERIQDLENANDIFHPGWRIPPPIDPGYPQAINEGIVCSDDAVDFYVFNPAIFLNGKFILFAIKDKKVLIGKSNNGLNDITWELTNCKYGSIAYVQEVNSFYNSFHAWNALVPGRCTNYFAGSFDGRAWSDMAADWTRTNGEDRNMIYENDEDIFMLFIRPDPPPAKRTIGYSESSNKYTWTPIREILRTDSSDPAALEFYEMSVIKTPRGFFGLISTYNRSTSLVDLQLAHSENGKNNWRRIYNRKNFIERRPGIKQIFGNWSLINDTVYIYTIENTEDHEHGGKHFSQRYKMALTDLYKYLI